MNTESTSTRLHNQALRVIPHGNPSLYRGHADVVMSGARGSKLRDVDGSDYIDLVSALGPMMHGNSPAQVVEAVTQSVSQGIQFSGPHYAEIHLAQRMLVHLPWADRVAFANSGSEAVQQAIRIARATTGRRNIVRFEGHYHGWIEPMFVNTNTSSAPIQGSESLTVHPVDSGLQAPGGVIVARWGDVTHFRQLMTELGDTVAAVIMEPAATSMGNKMPDLEYLNELKVETHRSGALVVLDEVVTGFRFTSSGLSGMLGFTPDLATYAKALGSGYPIAAVVGTEAAMASTADGRLSIVGTYNASPVGVAAAHAVLDICEEDPGLFVRVCDTAAALTEKIRIAAAEVGVPVTLWQNQSLVQVLVGAERVPRNYGGFIGVEKEATAAFSRALLSHGVYALPRGLLFASTAVTENDIELIGEAALLSFAELREKGIG